MNAEERLAKIETHLEALIKSQHEQGARMDRTNERLEVVARLEERWQSLDQRMGVLTQSFERELQRRARIDDSLFDRVRKLETSSGMNSHGRTIVERLGLLVGGGVALYLIQITFSG